MKKFILLSALSFAAFTSAKEKPKEKADVKKESSQKQKKGTKAKLQRICSQWYTIEAPCGAIYYLCGNNYWGMDDLHAAMDEFNDIKCP